MRAALALAIFPSLALAKPVTEKIGSVLIDYSAGTLAVPGAGAADMHAPNAQVARFKAERTARADAGKRLLATLRSLPVERLGYPNNFFKDERSSGEPGRTIDAAVAEARAEPLEWESDGSVTLTLHVPFKELLGKTTVPSTFTLPEPAPARVPGPRAAIILVDPKARPTIFSTAGRSPIAAPRFFETLSEARGAGAELAAASVRRGRWSASQSHDETGGPFRIVAVVKSGDGADGGKP